jgi:acetyl-CoA acetyltransferase
VKFENVFIPYRSYWSTPFCRWQGSLAGEHPLRLAAACAAKSLAKPGCVAARLQGIHFGMTVPQAQSFYGAAGLAALIGSEQTTGPTISQACATSARVLASAAASIELKSSNLSLAVAADKISNGPHMYYPDPSGPGGLGTSKIGYGIILTATRMPKWPWFRRLRMSQPSLASHAPSRMS